jgi:nitroreductase
VLHGAAVAGATVLVAATGAASYRVFDTRVLDPGHGGAFDPWRSWRGTDGALGAVAAAILAANPHNSQPWVFHVADSSIDLYADVSRRTGTLDPVAREQHVGLGCALENLVIAARVRGHAPTVVLLPSGPDSDLVAHVTLADAAPEPSEIYDAIGDRHTNRGPYRDEDVPVAMLAGLVDTAGLPGVDVHWVADDVGKAALGRLMIDAATAITHDDQQSRDSFAWFRSSDDAIQHHRDGLTLDMQGLSPVTLTVAKLLPASSRTAGDEFWVKQTRDVHTKTAAAYGIVTVTDPNDVSTRLLGGRLLQRVHLTATTRGVAVHHMNQITERIDRERTTGAEDTFGPRLAELLPSGVQALVAFRVGHPVRDARRSPRRPLSAVTR